MENNVAEREINLWDMLWAVCGKWRSILLWAIVFSLLAGGFSYYKSVKSVEVSSNTKQITLEELRNNLSYEEIQAVNAYFDYKQMYKEMCYYNENSPLMKLDANNFYKGEISYYVDNGFTVEYPIIDEHNNIVAMVGMYNAVVETDEFITQVKEALGDENDISYVMELIDSVDLYGGDKTIEKSEGDGVFSISVYAEDEETCTILKELVKNKIEASKKSVEKKFGKHEIVLIQDIVFRTNSSELLIGQKECVDRSQACATNMMNVSAKFTNNQKAYVAKVEENETEISGDSQDVNQVAPAATVSVKYVLIGFVGGAFIVFFVWVINYLFAAKLRLEDDFEKIYGKKLLGNIAVSDTKSKKWFAFVDRFFVQLRHFNQRYFEQEEALDMVAANIRITANKTGNKKIVVVGAAGGEDEKKVTDLLAKKLEKDGIELIWSNPILYNAESLEKAVQIGHLVMMERAEKSLYKEIKKEIEICKQHEINLIGCVVVY